MPPPPSPIPRMDVDQFLEHVRASQLVEPGRLAEVLQRMPVTDRARTVARHLVEKGLLTKFQAERLLMGKTEGFFLGQYRILDALGKGGMGRVFKAEHMTMGRVVALKMLNAQLLKTERARQLFEREVRAAARLNHPNIATAFDANQVGDRCYLVMEFVDGPNLQDLIREHGPLPVTQACDFIRQAAVGLQCAHDLGMVHRDIKPANLLVQKNASKATAGSYVVKILDFGLARLEAPAHGEERGSDSILTNKQTVMGTPDYLPPEQTRSLHQTDHRSDLYSLGCTFYFLLSGQVPFPGGTALEKMLKHNTDEPQPIEQLRPDVPGEVAAIIRKLMTKNPDDRFDSAQELAETLAPWAGENPAWLAIAPLPRDEQLPLVSSAAPAVLKAPTPDPHDPWANLDEEAGDPQTLTGQSGATRVGGITGRHRADAYSRSTTWLVMLWVVLALVGAGVILAVALIKRAAS